MSEVKLSNLDDKNLIMMLKARSSSLVGGDGFILETIARILEKITLYSIPVKSCPDWGENFICCFWNDENCGKEPCQIHKPIRM